MSVPEKPRIWMLERFGPTIASGRETGVHGAHLEDGEKVEVIERAPVEAELEELRRQVAALHERFLREHGRPVVANG